MTFNLSIVLSKIFQEKYFRFLSIVLTYIPLVIIYKFDLFSSGPYFGRLLIGICVLFYLNNKILIKPSDFFIYIFSFFPLASFIFFGDSFYLDYKFEDFKIDPILFEQNLNFFLVGLSLISLPLFVISYIPHFSFKLKIPFILNSKKIIYLLAIFSCAFIFLTIWHLESHFSITIADSYERRLAFRNQFPARTFFPYATSIISNTVIPLLAFSFYFLQKKLIIIPLFLAFLIFGILGTKATFGYISLALILAYLVKNNKLRTLPLYFLGVFSTIILFGQIENYYFETKSILLDRGIQRPFISPGITMSRYMDFIQTYRDFNVFSGTLFSESISSLIGVIYSNPEANDNCNTFLHAFAKGGFKLYFLSFAILFIMLFGLDSFSRTTNSNFAFYVSIFTAILLSEQFLFTSLLSSGIAMLYLLILFSSELDIFPKT